MAEIHTYLDKRKLIDALYEADAVTIKGTVIINTMEPADVIDRNRGKWISDPDGVPICSECEKPALQRVCFNLKSGVCESKMVLSEFCPHCGAIMDRRHE